MGRRRIAGERKAIGRERAVAHGASIGLLALRTLAVCGLLAGSAVGAIMSIGDGGGQIASPSAHLAGLPMRVPQTIALRKSAGRPPQQTLDDDFSVDEAAVTWAHRIPDDDFDRNFERDNDGYELLRFGSVRIRRGIVETIVRAARETGADPALLMAIADKESNFSTGVKAQTSSATGLFQFIDTTWFRVVRKFGASHGLAREAALVEGPDDKPYISDPRERAYVLGLRNDPYLSALFAAEMLQHDGGEIARSIGRDLTEGETYLTHFLGPQDATLFMEKVVDQPQLNAAKLLPKPASANRPIFFGHGRAKPLSVEAVHDKFEEMMGIRVDRYAKVDALTGASAVAE
jgi:hypothetical protein